MGGGLGTNWARLALIPLLVASGVLAAGHAVGVVHAAAPMIQIVSPPNGSRLTTDAIALRFHVADFTVDCTQSGRPVAEGVGHLHVMLDGLLVDLGCQDTFTISGDGLAPGTHTIVAVLADNQHHNLVPSRAITVDYQPDVPRPLPRAVELGTPRAQLVSPAEGATVPARFPVVLDAVNFVPLGALSAKPNVAGYGQWLIRVDGHDVRYGMRNTVDLDLTAWGPGPHTIGVVPVQNNHHGFPGVAPLEVHVVVSEPATPTP